MNNLMNKNRLSAYGATRKPIATYSMSGAFGIEILDEVEMLTVSGTRMCVVWRWSNERNRPRVSAIHDMADGESAFRANRQWIKLSNCIRA